MLIPLVSLVVETSEESKAFLLVDFVCVKVPKRET